VTERPRWLRDRKSQNTIWHLRRNSCGNFPHFSSVSLSHNYATKSPLVTIGRPKFTPKTHSSAITTHLTHPSTDRTHTQTASGSNQPFCHNTLSEQTDRQTDTQTDRWDRRQVYFNSAYALLILVSDALKGDIATINVSQSLLQIMASKQLASVKNKSKPFVYTLCFFYRPLR